MKRFFREHYHQILLFTGFVVLVVIMQYYYPQPNVSWDTEYYLKHSRTGNPGLRPIGYNEFLNFIYRFSSSLQAVVWVQYALYFLSVTALLTVFSKIFSLSKPLYLFTGLLMLAEPTGIYHCIAIYSDLLFSTLTYFYLATLLYFLYSRKWVYLLLHTFFVYLCLETRFIALFYPFFSLLAIVFITRGILMKLLSILLLLGAFKYSHQHYVNINKKTFGVAIHSAFSGWTHANNVMYALPRIQLAPKNLRAQHLRDIHEVMSDHVANDPYVVFPITTDYVWDGRSPLNKLLAKVEDSLRAEGVFVHDYLGMFVLAPRLEAYGLHIQTHYPYEYIMGYMVPNLKTLKEPHAGEMGDYYMHTQLSDSSMMRYNLKPEDIYCRKDIFKDTMSVVNMKMYQYRLGLFLMACVLLFMVRRFTARQEGVALIISIGFVLMFGLMTLYSSWFMFRYILPVIPVMTAVIVLAVRNLLMHGKHLKL